MTADLTSEQREALRAAGRLGGQARAKRIREGSLHATGPKPTCLCGECDTCKQREYARRHRDKKRLTQAAKSEIVNQESK